MDPILYLDKYLVYPNGTIRHKNKNTFLKLSPTSAGYRTFTIIYNGTMKRVKAHRIVAMCFIPNPENKPQVNHINAIRHDNRVENLEWCTQKENMQHSHRLRRNNGVLKNNDKKDINKILTLKGKQISISDISKIMGKSRKSINKILKENS